MKLYHIPNTISIWQVIYCRHISTLDRMRKRFNTVRVSISVYPWSFYSLKSTPNIYSHVCNWFLVCTRTVLCLIENWYGSFCWTLKTIWLSSFQHPSIAITIRIFIVQWQQCSLTIRLNWFVVYWWKLTSSQSFIYGIVQRILLSLNISSHVCDGYIICLTFELM